MSILQSKLAQRNQTQPDKNFISGLNALAIEGRRLGAMEGVQRLELICDQYDQLSPQTAYLWVDPNAFQREIEDTQLHKKSLEVAHFFRNLFSLAPLIATWYALFNAVGAYQTYVNAHPDEAGKPFLQLWQSGFGGLTAITFSLAAGVDVLLLSGFLLSILITQDLERRAHSTATGFVRDLQNKINELMKYITSQGPQHIASQSDIDKVVDGVKKVVDSATDAVKEMVDKTTITNKQFIDDLEQSFKQVMDNAQRSIQQVNDTSTRAITDANSRVDELFRVQVMPLMSSFRTDMGSLQQELANYQGRLNDLTNASNQLVGASQKLANASKALSDNADQYNDIGRDISTQIAALNTTQSDVLSQIQAVAGNISSAAGYMTGATSNMVAATKSVEGVANQLGGGIQTTFNMLSHNLFRATQDLVRVGPQFNSASYYLYYAAQSLSTRNRNPGILTRLLRRPIRQQGGGQNP